MASELDAVILARVSSKSQDDEGYSLDSQIKLLNGYCESKGLSVVKTFRIAETASKQHSRVIFHEMLEYISKNGIYHLTVEKTDRLTRNMRDALAIDDWLENDSHRRLHAVKENLLLHKESKSDVKFMWNIHLAVAKKYADNLREEAMKGWAEKLAQGWLPAIPPPGYTTVIQNGKRIHAPDKATARIVQRLLIKYLEPDQSIATITAEMKSSGLTTRKGKPFAQSHVQKILKNPFYIGINRFDGSDYPGAQVPLISKEIYDAIQQKLTGNRPIVFKKHNPVLKNLMTCASCGKTITWQKQKGRYYGACQRNSEACKNKKLVREDKVEEVIKEKLVDLICPSQGVMNWVVRTIQDEFKSSVDSQEEETVARKAQVDRLKRMDEMLYDDKLASLISHERYAQKHEQIQAQINALTDDSNAEKAANKQRQIASSIGIIELSQQAVSIYENKQEEDKRAVLTKLFETMVVDGDSVTVKYTKLAHAIAKKSGESRLFLNRRKSINQTPKIDDNNRGGDELEYALRPIWQGHVESNHDLGFWRPLY